MDPYVIFNDCRILCIELPDDGPYVTAYENIFLLCRRFLANYLYMCNTQQDAHYEENYFIFAFTNHNNSPRIEKIISLIRI
jgi:hypothetical protein